MKKRKFLPNTKKQAVHDYEYTNLSVPAIVKKYGLGHHRKLFSFLEELGVEYRRGVGPQKGERHHSWKGGYRARGAYNSVRIYPHDPMYEMATASGYVLEHRLVMARHLGRPLTKNETVHHIDGDVTHNVITNLELRQGMHGKGVRYVCVDCGSHNVQTTTLTERVVARPLEAGLDD